MPIYAYVLLAVGWFVWVLPFVLASRRARGAPTRMDSRARWGIVVQAIGYALLWQGRFWQRTPASWQIAGSALCLTIAAVFAWTGTQALGRHWRVDAGLDADHRLVREGPYRIVRHPIYASMLAMAAGTGLLLTPWPLFAAALALIVIGIEIRVRVEDALLGTQFGPEFLAYRTRVAAYLPFVR